MAISEQQLSIRLNAAGIKTTKAQFKQLRTELNATQKSVAGMAGAIAMATAGFYVASRAIGSVIKTGKEFEQGMANVKAISGATGSEFKALEKNAKDLGATTVFTASQVAGLQTEFAKLGFTAEEIKNVTADTLALSSAVGSDLATSAAVAGTTLRGFSLDVSETSVVTDTMALSFSRSALDMQKFTDSMSYVAPVAKMAGFSMQETTAVLGTLANSGISGSMAGTALRRIFLELSNESSKLTKRLGGPITTMDELIPAMEKLKEEGIGTAEMKELVGLRAVSAFSILMDGTDTLDELTEAFNNSGGAAQRMADIQLDTLEGKLTLAKSAMDGLKITMFNMSKGELVDLTVGFTEFINSIDEEDIKAYTASVKLLVGGFITYKGAVIAAKVATDGFSMALTRTGIGALAVVLGVTIAEFIKYSDVLKATGDEEEKEASRVNALANAIQMAEEGSITRNKLVDELNDIHPDLLQGLSDEEIAQGKVTERLEEYNKQQSHKIAFAKIDEESIRLSKEKAEVDVKVADSTVELTNAMIEFADSFGGVFDSQKTFEENYESLNKQRDEWVNGLTDETKWLNETEIKLTNSAHARGKLMQTYNVGTIHVESYLSLLEEQARLAGRVAEAEEIQAKKKAILNEMYGITPPVEGEMQGPPTAPIDGEDSIVPMPSEKELSSAIKIMSGFYDELAKLSENAEIVRLNKLEAQLNNAAEIRFKGTDMMKSDEEEYQKALTDIKNTFTDKRNKIEADEYKKNRKLAEDFAKKSQSAFNKFYKEKDTTLLDRLNDEYDRQVKAIKSSIMADEDKYDALIRLEKEYQAARKNVQETMNQEELDRQVEQSQLLYEQLEEAATQTLNLASSIFGQMADLYQADMDADRKRLESQMESRIKDMENRGYTADQIERFRNTEQAKIDEEMKEQEEKLKEVRYNEAIIATLSSAVNAYNSAAQTPFIGWILGPVAAAAALYFGYQKANMIKSMEQGGMVGGRLHSQGGTLIEAERGEFVMSRRAVDAVGVEEMNRINEGEANRGGDVVVNVSGNVMTEEFVNTDLADAIRTAVRRGTDFGIK